MVGAERRPLAARSATWHNWIDVYLSVVCMCYLSLVITSMFCSLSLSLSVSPFAFLDRAYFAALIALERLAVLLPLAAHAITVSI